MSDRDANGNGSRRQRLSVLWQRCGHGHNDVNPHAVTKAHVVGGVQSPVRGVATRGLRGNHINRDVVSSARLDRVFNLVFE